jgi:hypothetical protein
MTEKNQNFPNGIEAFFLLVALFGIEFIISAVMHDMRDWLGLAPQDVGDLVTVLASGIVFAALMHYKSLSYRDLFHASPYSAGAIFLALVPAIALTIPALVLMVLALSDVLVAMFPMSASQIAVFEERGSGSLGVIIGACILAPVLEEMLFRGIILRSFLTQYSRWVAIGGSALLFGLAHMNIYQCAVGLVIGVVNGWLYERTDSLLPCITLHAAYNSTLTLISLSVASGAENSFANPTPEFYFASLLLATGGVFMLRRALVVSAD